LFPENDVLAANDTVLLSHTYPPVVGVLRCPSRLCGRTGEYPDRPVTVARASHGITPRSR